MSQENNNKLNSRNIKSDKIWFAIFIIIGLLGILDMGTKSVVEQNYGIKDIGIINFASFNFFRYLFGTSVAASLSGFVNIILSLSILWFLVAFVFRSKANKKEKESSKSLVNIDEPPTLKEGTVKKRKLNYKYLLIVIILIPVVYLIYLSSITQALIKRDFNKAFIYRTTGDCTAFAEFINMDHDDWKNRCENEKKRSNDPINDYKILRISNKLGSNKAFIQVELTRDVDDKKQTYSVTYEMTHVGLRWKIDQEMK